MNARSSSDTALSVALGLIGAALVAVSTYVAATILVVANTPFDPWSDAPDVPPPDFALALALWMIVLYLACLGIRLARVWVAVPPGALLALRAATGVTAALALLWAVSFVFSLTPLISGPPPSDSPAWRVLIAVAFVGFAAPVLFYGRGIAESATRRARATAAELTGHQA